jgi:hypothetical protein
MYERYKEYRTVFSLFESVVLTLRDKITRVKFRFLKLKMFTYRKKKKNFSLSRFLKYYIRNWKREGAR